MRRGRWTSVRSERSGVVLMMSGQRAGATGRPENQPPRSTARVSAWLAVGLAFSELAVMGCDQSPSTIRSEAERAAQEGWCLAQLHTGGSVELVSLDQTWREHKIPLKDDAALLYGGRVSPEGTYGVGTDGRDLVAVTLDGRELWHLNSVSVSGRPAISPDGKKVAFTSRNRQLSVYDVSTSELKSLGVRGQNPTWAPSGDRLAYDDGAQAHVFDLARGAGVEVGRGTEPSWSPDGTSVAVRVGPKQVDVVYVQTLERRVLIEASSDISVPRWSPNGEWMMYTRRGPRHWWSKAEWTGSEPSQILIRHVKTGTDASVGEFYKANPGDYTWVTNRELCQATPPAR